MTDFVTADFILEIGSEEIPAQMQKSAGERLALAITKKIADHDLAHDPARIFVTPRRLALVITGLPTRRADRQEEKRGPRVDAPQAALDGFVRTMGLTAIDQCTRRKTAKGEFYFVQRTVPGKDVGDILAQVIGDGIDRFSWPKSMRWGSGSLRWIRPIRWVMALFNGQKVAGSIDTIPFIDHSRPHRFYTPPTPIAKADILRDGYAPCLEDHRVIADAHKRQTIIIDGILEQSGKRALCPIGRNAADATTAKNIGMNKDVNPSPPMDRIHSAIGDKIALIAGLAEYPRPFIGDIDSHFVEELPDFVIETVAWQHQYYLPLYRDGRLAPHFIAVADMPDPVPETVIKGNERVLRARLDDALFHIRRDLQIPLAVHGRRLDTITFHARLGTMHQKRERLIQLADKIGADLGCPPSQRADLKDAATLAKADLATHMVAEFGKLRGRIGAYYAKHQQKKSAEKNHSGKEEDRLCAPIGDAVCDAIRDHERPRDASDQCPQSRLAALLALIDKIDSLVGLWMAEGAPSASRDPFGLRRTAIGIVRLAEKLDIGLRLIGDCLDCAWDLYRAQKEAAASSKNRGTGTGGTVVDNGHDQNTKDAPAKDAPTDEHAKKATLDAIGAFLRERLMIYSRDERAMNHDTIAVISAYSRRQCPLPEHSIGQFFKIGTAFPQWIDRPAGIDARHVYRRSAAILAKADTVSTSEEKHDPREDELTRSLAAALRVTADAVKESAHYDDLERDLALYAQLRKPMDAFLDRVMVMADDRQKRARRVALMRGIADLGRSIIRFDLLPGS